MIIGTVTVSVKIRLVRTCHPHCCSLLSTRSCWFYTRAHSQRRSGRLPPSPSWRLSFSGLVLGVQIIGALRALLLIDSSSITLFLCASLSVLGALCCFLQRHILQSLVCEDPPSVSWFEHPTEGYDSRDRLLWLFAADHGLMESFTVQSYLSAHLRCAAYISPVSACWLYS